MRQLVYDIETNGLLKELTRIHCLNTYDTGEKKHYAFNAGKYDDSGEPCQRDGSIEDGLKMLAEADEIIGHNVIRFDNPAITKVVPGFKPKGKVTDTLVMCNVVYTDLTDRDFSALRKGRLPEEFQKGGLIGSQSLEAWGHRLGEHKGEFTVPEGQDKWALFTSDMDKYARQDPVVTLALYNKLIEKNYSAECIELEHRIAQLIFRQYEHGFAFDKTQADALTRKLQVRHAELESELQKVFKPWQKSLGMFTPKKDNKKRGYKAGVPVEKFKEVVFNPASRDHIADRLIAIHGWKPSEFTNNGKPKVDETILEALPYPEAKLLSEYLMVEKRLGQVANGKEAWLKHATDKGIYGLSEDGVLRVHGGVNTNGAVTGRMTHNRPNVAQTPANHAAYGEECRACWTVTDSVKYALVGCDAEGLELRCLAHYMAKWDGGAYAEAVVNGKKEDQTDVHNVNKRAAGLNSRDNAKTFIYALIYGAGDFKLGTIVYEDFTDLQKAQYLEKYKTKRDREKALKALGRKRRARIMEQLPALKKLTDAVKAAVVKRGYLIGLDGRLLHVRSEHAALNTLLQSAGAVVMKKALVLYEDTFASKRRSTKTKIEYVANIHDEVQQEVSKSVAEEAGKQFAACIAAAGEHFNFRCPLAGNYAIGSSWKDTH